MPRTKGQVSWKKFGNWNWVWDYEFDQFCCFFDGFRICQRIQQAAQEQHRSQTLMRPMLRPLLQQRTSAEPQQRPWSRVATKIFEDLGEGSVKNLLLVRNLYQLSTTLGLEPASSSQPRTTCYKQQYTPHKLGCCLTWKKLQKYESSIKWPSPKIFEESSLLLCFRGLSTHCILLKQVTDTNKDFCNCPLSHGSRETGITKTTSKAEDARV